MAAGKYNFIIQQGSTFRRLIQYTDSNGSPIDLTDYSARMQIRESVDSNVVLVNLTTNVGSDGSGIVITPASGTLDITLSAVSSSQLSFTGEAVYDLEIYSGSGDSTYVARILEGKVKLSKEVTR
jgi:hypothetical protein